MFVLGFSNGIIRDLIGRWEESSEEMDMSSLEELQLSLSVIHSCLMLIL